MLLYIHKSAFIHNNPIRLVVFVSMQYILFSKYIKQDRNQYFLVMLYSAAYTTEAYKS